MSVPKEDRPKCPECGADEPIAWGSMGQIGDQFKPTYRCSQCNCLFHAVYDLKLVGTEIIRHGQWAYPPK